MAPIRPAFCTVDLDVGESSMVELEGCRTVALKLVSVHERRDPVLNAVRDARARVLVDGRDVTIRSGVAINSVGGLGGAIDITAGEFLSSLRCLI